MPTGHRFVTLRLDNWRNRPILAVFCGHGPCPYLGHGATGGAIRKIASNPMKKNTSAEPKPVNESRRRFLTTVALGASAAPFLSLSRGPANG